MRRKPLLGVFLRTLKSNAKKVFLRIAWVFLRISVYFCVLLQATVLGFSNKSQEKIAISRMSIDKLKCLARKRSGGRVYGEADKSPSPTDRIARKD